MTKLILLSSILVLRMASVSAADEKAVSKIRQILKPFGSTVGLSVRNHEGKEVLSIQGDQEMSPASIIKLFSTGCSLSALGPEFQFETPFGTNGKIRSGILQGDLIVRGSGDPSFVIENLRDVLDKIKHLYEIEEIRGEIIFDLSYFGVPRLSISDDFEGDESRSFNAALTAIPFNFNSYAAAGAAFDGKTFVKVFPDYAVDMVARNDIHFSPGLSDIQFVQLKEKEISLKGKMGSGMDPKFFYRSAPDPLSMLAQVIVQIWSDLGGTWAKPKFRLELKPVSMVPLYTHRSQPLAKMLMDINKLSTNFGAEMIALAAGAKNFNEPASYDKVQKMMKACWQDLKLPADRFKIFNASGLSRETLIRPSDLSFVLSSFQKKYFWPEFLSSLSILGKDGTTRKRLSHRAGDARLKTGSIKGVRTLAGIFRPQGGDEMVFSLFRRTSDTQEWISVENQILEILLESRL